MPGVRIWGDDGSGERSSVPARVPVVGSECLTQVDELEQLRRQLDASAHQGDEVEQLQRQLEAAAEEQFEQLHQDLDVSAQQATELEQTCSQLQVSTQQAEEFESLRRQLDVAARPAEQLEQLDLQLTKKSSILDVGSGAGETLIALNHFGFYNLTGVDPFLAASLTYSNGVRVLKAEL